MAEPAPDKPAAAAPKAPPALMLQLPKVAAAALVVSQIPWAIGIVDQFRMDQAPLASWNLLVLLWCLAAAILLWRRVAPVFPIALITSWYVAGLSIVFAMTYEIPLFWFALGAAGVAVVAITKAREGLPGVKPARPAPTEGETFAQWAKENVEAIVVAFIMALVIRCFCIEVFKIPSSSMEPTLLGDVTTEHTPGDRELETDCPAWFEHYSDVTQKPRRGGDRIMVTKYYYSFTDVQRYDVVVFKFPLNQSKNFIKRVVGLPSERLYVHEGNLFTDGGDGSLGTGDFTVARRLPRTQNSAWVNVRPSDGSEFLDSPESFKDRWTALPLSAGTIFADSVVDDGVLSTRENGGTRDVRFRFPRPRGNAGWKGNDVRLAFDFTLTSPTGTVFAAVRNAYGTFTLRLSTKGDSRFQWHLPGRDTGPHWEGRPLPELRIEPDRRYRLEVGVYDGTAYARLDREELRDITVFEKRGDLDRLYKEDAFKNMEPDHALEFGTEGATFDVRDLRVARDFYYQLNDRSTFSEDEPVRIKDGHYMMMGDNVENSHDSRMWRMTVFTLQDDTEISAEGQEISRSGIDVQERYGLESTPDIHIKADKFGREWALYRAENAPGPADLRRRGVGVLKEGKAGEATPADFQLVDEKFIVGKAFWIWWPVGRWFTLIR